MKTEPMAHQLTALERMDGKWHYALFMEQGTGKTWAFLADAQRYHERGKIDGLFVVAPNGVHTNWVRREIPAHMEEERVLARYWRTSASKTFTKHMEEVLMPAPGKLRVFTIPYESLRSPRAREFVRRFLRSGRMIGVLDESQKVKNPDAAVTKALMELRPEMTAVRIGTGTPMDKPQDIFSQFEFMAPAQCLLGTMNFRAFVAEFSVLADWKDPKTSSDWAFAKQVEKHPRMKHALIVARDEDTGQPIYRNLDRLQKMIAAHSYRVLKKDCLDLPEKLYTSLYFDLSPEQMEAYTLMESEFRIRLENGEETPVSALASLVKLQQITSGYVVVPGREEPMYIGDGNPRVEAIANYVAENVSGKVIIWCRFREEIRVLAGVLRAAGRVVVEYHGDVKEDAREDAVDLLQNGNADVFIGIQKAGGTGLTLTAATTTIYCSNEYSSLVRLQSEDRNHRKGTIADVLYIDVVATGTIDEAITKAHQYKTEVTSTILGDRGLDLRGLV